MADTEKKPETAKKGYKIKNNGANLRYVEGVRLPPGVETEVSADIVDKIKASKAGVAMLDKKTIELIG